MRSDSEYVKQRYPLEKERLRLLNLLESQGDFPDRKIVEALENKALLPLRCPTFGVLEWVKSVSAGLGSWQESIGAGCYLPQSSRAGGSEFKGADDSTYLTSYALLNNQTFIHNSRYTAHRAGNGQSRHLFETNHVFANICHNRGFTRCMDSCLLGGAL